MSIEIYRVLHLSGILVLFLSLGGILISDSAILRKKLLIGHGAGLAMILVAGFGLLARKGYSIGSTPWVWGKIAIWLVLGGLVAVANRKPNLRKPLWFGVCCLGVIAVYLVVMKPSM
ncbi:MAG: hypothetical protein ACI86H_001885 [bacterium]|jgi:hypothetical protein